MAEDNAVRIEQAQTDSEFFLVALNSMDAGHPLKTLLQLQLGSDSYAVLHLPHILTSLTAESLAPSPHSSKWTARINSLLHSKTADARWAGLCIAQRTSVLSKSTMIECAQGWIGMALPVLSVREFITIVARASSSCVLRKRNLPP